MKHLLLLLLVVGLCFTGFAAPPAQGNADSLALQSLKALEQRARMGDNEARFRLARTLENGYGTIVERDSARARSLFETAAREGFAPAQNYLGFLLFEEGRCTEAVEWMMKAADSGDITAYTNLGWMLLNGKGAVKDVEKALYWLRQGADKGSAPAAAMLGDIYSSGNGVKPDSALAIDYYNSALALYKQGAYADKRAIADISTAIRHLFPNPQSLTVDSLMSLGRRYLDRAPAAAMYFIHEAALKNDPVAQAILAKGFAFGYGLPYSHEQCIIWYLRSALAGNASAQFVLGELLQMFPDSLAKIPPELSAALKPEQLSGQYWTEMARSNGIIDARRADDALGTPKFP